MLSSKVDYAIDPRDQISEKLPIHKKWRKRLVELPKEQVNQIEEPEEWQEILLSWDWFKRLHPWIITTMNMLAFYPATTAYLLANDYLFDQGIEIHNQTKKERQKIASAFRRAFQKLYKAGLIKGMPLKPEDVGEGRRSVTIWLAPWAKDKDIEPIVEFYTVLAEGRIGKELAQKKSEPKQLTEHNRKVKVLSMLDKYRATSHLEDHYKCPKKHGKGLMNRRKLSSAIKKRKYARRCPNCDRELIEITIDEFLELKKKELCKRFSIKL